MLGGGETWVNQARLLNYLGIEEIEGPTFLERARAQVRGQGAVLREEEAIAIRPGFEVDTASGTETADYVILATGPKPKLMQGLGLSGRTVEADRDGRTAVDRFYAAGWAVRPDKIQAIVSAGDGAAAALDILSREKGKDFHDFDEL